MDPPVFKQLPQPRPPVKLFSYTTGYFGSVASISGQIRSFYTDNSYNLSARKQQLSFESTQKMQHKLKENHSKIATWKQQNEEIRAQNEKLEVLMSKVQERYSELALMESSAVQIQKVVRGSLVRKNIDELVIDFRRKNMANWFRVLRKNDFQLLFHVGQLPAIAAQALQRAVRRFLFRRKIARLQRVYDIKLNEKMYAAFGVIRRSLYTFNSTLKARWRRHRLEALKKFTEETKYKLSCLRIKKHWKRMRLSIKLMRQKIKKYKRKLKAAETVKALEESQEVPKKLEDTEEAALVDSEEEREHRERGRERQAKVDLGRISYNINKHKELTAIPYFEQRDNGGPFTVASPKRNPSDLVLKSLFDEEGFPLCLRPPPPLVAKPKPLRRTSGQPLYMKATLVSRMNRWDVVLPQPQVQNNNTERKLRLNSTLMNSTQTQLSKKRAAVSLIRHKPEWVPVISMKKKYLPGLDNQCYKPVPANRALASRTTRLRPLIVETESFCAPVPEPVKSSVFSLDFTSALPEFSSILNYYSNSLRIHVKSRSSVMQPRLSKV